MKHLYYGVLFYITILPYSAQETLWQKDIASSTQDFLIAVTPTIDRQVLVVGNRIGRTEQLSTTEPARNNGYDYTAVKLSQEGNILWRTTFGGTKHDYLSSAISTGDGGFLLSGTSHSNQSGNKKADNIGGSDVWLIRLNENGEEVWQQTLGTKANDEASGIAQTTDGGFMITGQITRQNNLFGAKDIFICKLDKSGKILNTIIIGGKSNDEVMDIKATKDGGAVVLAYSRSGKSEDLKKQETESQSPTSENNENKAKNLLENVSQFVGKATENFGEGDFWIIKLDKNAKVQWQKNYGGKEDDLPKKIANSEKGFIVLGETQSNASGNKRGNIEEGTDLWILSLDENGNEIWQKTYNFGGRDVAMSLDVITKTNKDNFSEDKGYLVGGYTQAEGLAKTDDEKFWLLYLDSNGKVVWRKHVEGTSKKKEERLVAAKLQSNGSFLLAGTSADELGKENWKILKLGDKDIDQLIEKKDLWIYPNPVEDYCYVEIGFPMQQGEEATISIVDMSGKQLQTIKTKTQITKINTSGWVQGVYVASVQTSIKTVNTKIVKK